MTLSQENSVSYDLPLHVDNLPEQVARNVAGYQSKIAGYLFESSCLGRLDRVGTHHYLPALFLKYFRKAMALYDESLQFLLSYLRSRGFDIRCHPQCSHCCYHMPVGVSCSELLYLYYGMTQSGMTERFFRRCMEAEESWAAVLLRRTTVAGGSRAGSDDHALEALLADYQQIEQPCPFLQNDLCQLYSYRPLACRMHFSLSPPSWCHPAHFQNPHALQFNLEPGECVVEGLNRLDARLQLSLSDIMVRGLLELTVNIMRFEEIRWLH